VIRNMLEQFFKIIQPFIVSNKTTIYVIECIVWIINCLILLMHGTNIRRFTQVVVW
jgi:hypothetical protein